MGFHSFKSKDRAKTTFQYITNHDNIKYNYCVNKNIPLLLISYRDIKIIENILDNWVNLFALLQKSITAPK